MGFLVEVATALTGLAVALGASWLVLAGILAITFGGRRP